MGGPGKARAGQTARAGLASGADKIRSRALEWPRGICILALLALTALLRALRMISIWSFHLNSTSWRKTTMYRGLCLLALVACLAAAPVQAAELTGQYIE